MKIYIVLFLYLLTSCGSKQELTPVGVLEKSIQYHDPNNNWGNFSNEITVVMSSPDGNERVSKINLNLPEDSFKIEMKRDSTVIAYEVKSENCKPLLNGSSEINEEDRTIYNISCDRGMMYKNYYTYLYGLPMKLKDPGTIINENLEYKTFNDKDYVVIQVTYEAEVGSDIWYFYFDPNTYAMEIYQFFKIDDKGKESIESGEYILLSGIETIDGILMPKERKWYYNKDQTYLGTDILK